MISLIALLAAAAAAPAYPADAVFGAFAQVCRRVADYPAAAKAANGKGWTEVPSSDEPHLDKLVALGKEAVPDARKSGASYRRAVKGRTLYLVLSRYEDAKLWGNGCHVYDFAAPAEIPQATLERLMRRPCTFRQAQDGVLTKLTWDDGLGNGAPVEAAYVPKGSPLTARTGLAGLVLVAQATGQVAPSR